jgi:hypothetical protein
VQSTGGRGAGHVGFGPVIGEDEDGLEARITEDLIVTRMSRELELSFKALPQRGVWIGCGHELDARMLESALEDAPDVVMMKTGNADPQSFGWVHAG